MTIKRIAILPDCHLSTKSDEPYEVVKKFLKSYKPDEIVLLGDFMDCEALSHWTKDKLRGIDGRKYKHECDFANKELDKLQKLTKKITYLEGNHEAWVEQYIDRNPEMEGLIEIPNQLNLKKRNIKWYPYNSLYKIGHCYLTHGSYATKYHTQKHLQAFGCNLVYGHVHRPQSDMINMKQIEPTMAYALGCLCNHEPSYMKGKPANWMHGFGILEVDTNDGTFNLTPINIINNKFIYNGVVYR